MFVGVILCWRGQSSLEIEHGLTNSRVHAGGATADDGVAFGELVANCVVAIEPLFSAGLEPARAGISQALLPEQSRFLVQLFVAPL